MQPRASRAGGRPHPFGCLGGAEPQVVDQDDDCPMLDAELPKGAVELVLGCDARCLVGDTVPGAWKQPKVAAVTSFALLADPTRVRMLWALRDAELDVATLAGIADCRPTVASQHLSKLRLAGLVEGTRDGRRIVYRLRGGHLRKVLTEALFHADHQVSGEPVHD